MQTSRLLLTVLSTVVLASQFSAMPTKSQKNLCAMTCHTSDSKPAHPSMAKLDQVYLMKALQGHKQDL